MNVAVTSTSFSANPRLREELLRHFPDARLNTSPGRLAGEALAAFADGCDALIVGLEEIDASVLAALPKVQIISKFGVGLDNIDLDACTQRNVAIGWTGGVNRLSVAEMTIGFMLALCRNLFSTSCLLKNGIWQKNGGRQLTGRTVGVIGAGNIGQEVVRLLAPFNCRVLVNDIIDMSAFCRDNNVEASSKEAIFNQAEIITLHTPLTELTRGLIRSETLALMRRDACLINTARGPIVVQADLQQALQQGVIAGAALDVYSEEPPTDLTFLGLPNLICTPHIGGNSAEAVIAMGMNSIQHLREYACR